MQVTSAPRTVRLALVSLELHDMEVEVTSSEELAIMMEMEPVIKKAESEILPEEAKEL